MSNLAYSVIYPQPRKLTLGVVLALSLFTLTVNAQTVVRYNSNGEITASGDDIGAVQGRRGVAVGDVIKVSDGATFNTDVIGLVSRFTVESSTGYVVNVPVQAWYNFPQIPAAPVNATFRNVSFTSSDSYTSNFWGGDLNQRNIIGITIDGNVSFSNFKDSVFHYYKTVSNITYCPYKFTCTSGSSLTFSGNTTNGNGAAIVTLSELNGNGSFMTFSGNEATNGGAIFLLDKLTGEKNQLTFSNNKANGTGDNDGGGAIWSSHFSGSDNTLTFTGNTAITDGGAIYMTSLSGSGNTLDFSGNTAKDGGAIDTFSNLTGEKNQLTFSKNTANGTGITDGGGAIYFLQYLGGSGNTLEFSENTAAKNGGAIYKLADLYGSGNKLKFEGNTAADSGGAIYYISGPSPFARFGNNNILTFSNNKAGTDGGAISNLGHLNGNNNTLTFTSNTAGNRGGAIFELPDLSGSGNTLTFSNNIANGTGSLDGGGAILSLGTVYGSGNILNFSENTTAKNGGAIHRFGSLYGSGNILDFSENTAAESGGAIYRVSYFSGNNNQLTFSKNTANGTGNTDGGGAIGNLTNLPGYGNTLTFSGNTAEGHGGAINNLSYLSGSDNTLEFTDNIARNGDGGAIYNLTNFSGSGNTLKFSENTAKLQGGAIYKLGYLGYSTTGLTGNNNKLTFSNNKANGTGNTDGGGAIYNLTNFSGSGNKLEFSENTAAKSGGAIYRLGYSDGTLGLTGNNNQLTFSKNKANGTGDDDDGGGAIYNLTNFSGSGNTLEFSENTAAKSGGAIWRLGYPDEDTLGLTGNNNKLTFSNNKANGTGDEDGGGAIYELKNLSGSGNTLKFEGNTATKNGGAIGSFTTLSGENNTLTFTGNTAGGNGGAIYSIYSIEFNGNNTLTFTGNKAGTKGNDIYLYGSDNTPANLTFSGGTHSFDGGIWLDKHPEGEYGTTTIADGANVTIAGRDDDSVNEYEFRDVALTANLTATVDDIEYLHGNFSVGENGLMTINKGDDTATIKSSTNYGVMDLLINKAEEVETISISSGRIDIKGYMDASIELQNDAEHPTTFSPGNSVGHVDIDGDFILNAGTTLLIEMDATGIDTMAATSFDLDNGTISFTLSDEIPGGASYDILTAKNGTPFDEDIITRMLNGQTLPEYYTLALAGPSNNIVRFSIDRNAVPEPSTWALLILGAAGLAYMRKRK